MVKSESKTLTNSKELLKTVKSEIVRDNIIVGENTFTVMKRNGTIVPFRKERIYRAIEAAFRDTKKIEKEEELPSDIKETADAITTQVVEQLFELARKNVSLNVEGIQDLVEVTLMKNGHHDVARDYIIYRDHHKALRSDDPRNLKIIRKDSASPVRFNPIKIATSIERIFRRVNKIEGATPDQIISIVNILSQQVVEEAVQLAKTEPLHVHHLQNLVEEVLMRAGYFQAAKDYILYRAAHGEQTSAVPEVQTKKRRKAKKDERAQELINHAQKLEELGCFALVLELNSSSESCISGEIVRFFFS